MPAAVRVELNDTVINDTNVSDEHDHQPSGLDVACRQATVTIEMALVSAVGRSRQLE